MNEMKKRLLALVLAVCLCVTMLPVSALAAEIEIVDTPTEAELPVSGDDSIAIVEPETPAEAAPAAGDEILSADGVAVDAATFPDDIFRAWVSENCDTDGDGALSEDEIAAVTTVEVSGRGIASLKGIEIFTACISLSCSDNQLTELDVSHNTALSSLYVGRNKLTALDVSALPELGSLSCEGNALETLDVSNNPLLAHLFAGSNQLTVLDVSANEALALLTVEQNALSSLDVTHNPDLTTLSCGENPLTELDLSQNPALDDLYCGSCSLTELDVSHNLALRRLSCQNNHLTALDISQNTALQELDCDVNELSALDVTRSPALTYLSFAYNQVSSVDVSACSGLRFLNTHNNALSELDVSQCPDIVTAIRDGERSFMDGFYEYIYSAEEDNYIFTVDARVQLTPADERPAEGLPIDETNFPDEIFRAWVSENCDATGDGLLNDGELASVTMVDVSGSGIASLKGIELFPDLVYLFCPNNQLTELDLSQNPALFLLDCSGNQLTALDVSNNPALDTISASNNALAALDVSRLPELTSLVVSENRLAELDLSQNTALVDLICDTNGLSSLILPDSQTLETIFASDNALTELYVSGLPALRSLFCFGNQLTELDVTHNPALTQLGCYVNELTELDLSQNPALTSLHCALNQLTELDVSTAPELTELFCYDNQLTELDLSHNTKLSWFSCFDNPLTALDLSACPELYDVECFNTQIATLDLRPCPKLLRLIRKVEPDDCGIFWEYNLTVDEQIWRLQIGKETTLILGELPSVTLQPKSVSVAVDTMASFVVAAEGDGLSYQWQYRTSASGSWHNCTVGSATTAALNIKATAARSGYQYRCQISNSTGTVSSDPATLTVIEKPTITTQPASVSAAVGSTVKISVKAGGTGLSYQWQYRTSSSGSWKNSTASTAKTATISVGAESYRNGYQYRCKVTNVAGTVTSSAATLTVVEKPTITTQPASVTATAGTTVKISVKASGTGLSYQWQYRTSSSGSWKNSTASTAKTATISVGAEIYRDGYQYRCKVSNIAGTVSSSAATLTVIAKPVITKQPTDILEVAGAEVEFTVTAKGDDLSYQWQYRTSASDFWKDSGAATAKKTGLIINTENYRDGYQYRCKVTNTAGTVTSDIATLHIKLAINKEPSSATVYAGNTVKFTLTASGSGLSYQWQYRTSASGSWSNTALSGNKTATLSFKAPYSRNGYQYRCKVSNDTGTVYTRVVTLKVSKLPVITDQPDSQVTTGGTTVKLSVKAEGVTSYQWYYRPGSSGAWLPCTGTGAKTATLSVYARVAESGYQYRCKLTNDEGSVNTRSVTLTVKER